MISNSGHSSEDFFSENSLRGETIILNCLEGTRKTGSRLILTEKGSSILKGTIEGFPFSCSLKPIQWKTDKKNKFQFTADLEFIIEQCATVDKTNIKTSLFTNQITLKMEKRMTSKGKKEYHTLIYWLNYKQPSACIFFEEDSDSLQRKSRLLNK